jgi:hypothetical protein
VLRSSFRDNVEILHQTADLKKLDYFQSLPSSVYDSLLIHLKPFNKILVARNSLCYLYLLCFLYTKSQIFIEDYWEGKLVYLTLYSLSIMQRISINNEFFNIIQMIVGNNNVSFT